MRPRGRGQEPDANARADARPARAHPPHPQLWITGNGNNNPGNPNMDDEDVLVCAVLAVDSGTPCAVLWQVPNAPVVYASDPAKQERSEDAAVAWSCAWWRGGRSRAAVGRRRPRRRRHVCGARV